MSHDRVQPPLTCTIVVSHLKGTATVYKPQCTNPMYLGGAFQARVHPCTLGYMRVAGHLWLLLKTVKQLAGTIKATMAQVICTMGFKGVWDLYFSAVVCLPWASPSGTNPIHLETHGTNITCTNYFCLP